MIVIELRYVNTTYYDVNSFTPLQAFKRKDYYDFDIKEANNNSLILRREIEKWNNFSYVLKKQNRRNFREMLKSVCKYSNAINAKGEQFSTESLIISILFEQDKIKN